MRTQRLRSAMDPKYQPMAIVSEIVRLLGKDNHQNRDFANKVSGALRAKNPELALSLAVDPSHTVYGDDIRSFLIDRQISALVRKVPWDLKNIDPAESAIKKFLATEHRMKRINTRFHTERRLSKFEKYAEFRAGMRRYISSLIGDKPDMDIVLPRCDFGPGASVGVSGVDTSIPAKLEDNDLTVTPGCLPYALSAICSNSQMMEMFYPQKGGIFSYDLCLARQKLLEKVRLVPYNKIALVPKTAIVHRTIAIEPSLNSFVQKGVDLFLRDRLASVGVDLSDQSRNQRLARVGSFTDMFDPLCTLDLESASDSVSRGVLRDLFPCEWYEFLRDISSPAFLLPNESTPRTYHKFASMGNGVCFPVETLIFWAAIQVTLDNVRSRRLFGVYGDDIIVPQGAALLLVELLNYLGFRVNRSKSFFFGSFRESCGTDWHEGRPVRPYILDSLPRCERDVMKIRNSLLRYGTLGPSLDRFLISKTKNCPARPIGTSEAIDDALHLEIDAYMTHWSSRWDRSIQNWAPTVFRDKAKTRKPPVQPAVQMYCILRGCSSRNFLPDITLRRLTRTVMTRTSYPLRIAV